MKQDTEGDLSCFLAFNVMEVENYESAKIAVESAKAISIQAVSSKKFLVLDSAGVVHLVHLHNSVHGSDFSYNIEQLTRTMKVRKLAVLPGTCTGIQPYLSFRC